MCVRMCVSHFLTEIRSHKLILSRFYSLSLYSNAIGKNTAQTDEEKQRERQRNERELKHAELEAQHLKVCDLLIFYLDFIVLVFFFGIHQT